jgi:hypothetical protein
MSDPDSTDALMKAGTHILAGGGTGGLVAWASHWLKSKESQAMTTELALLRNDVNGLSKSLEKHANVNERLALVESSLKALHNRMDDLDPKSKRNRR